MFISFAEGIKGYLFMRSPNNVVFTAVKALFDETMFPKCPEIQQRGFTPIGDQPSDDSNIPLEVDGHNNSDADDDLFPPAPKNWRARMPPPPPPGDASVAPEDSDSDSGNWLEQAKREHLSQQNTPQSTPQWRNVDLPSTPRPSRTHELPGSPPLRRSLYREFQDMPVRGHPPNSVALMKSDNPAPTSIPTPYVPPHRRVHFKSERSPVPTITILGNPIVVVFTHCSPNSIVCRSI